MKKKFNIQYLLYYGAVGSIFPLLSRYLSEVLEFNGKQIGTILALPPLIGLFTLPLFGAVYDNVKKPKKLIFALIMIATGIVFFIPQAQSFVFSALLITTFQFFNRPVGSMLDSYTIQATKEENLDYGSVRTFGSWGYVLASFFLGFLVEFTSLKVIFYSVGIFLILSMLNLKGFKNYQRKVDKHSFLKDLKDLSKNKEFIILIISYSLIFGISNVSNGYDSVRLAELGYGSIYIGVLIFSQVFFELLLMKHSEKIINKFGYIKPFLVGGLAISLKWAVYYFTTNLWVFILFASLHGFMIALFLPTAIKYINKIVPENVLATALMLLSSALLMTLSIFLYLTGFIYDGLGMEFAYMLYFILSILGILLVGLLKKITTV